MTPFHWAQNVQQQVSGGSMGVSGMQRMLSQFGALDAAMSPWGATAAVGYAALPDFRNSGKLRVNKQAGTVTTPGGYNIQVRDGQVRIQTPDGKWTQLKAEPPNRTLVNTTDDTETRTTSTVERQLRRDPVVRESDGDVWRYQGTGSFHLPDGTKITIHEKGSGKDLHIDQVDIYNGNKHVGIKSQLTSSEWQTIDRRVERSTGDWRTTSSRRQTTWRGRRGQVTRTDTEQRTTRTTTTETQRANQQFATTFSNVARDGFAHDAATADGHNFHIAGDGAAWAENGREAISGAGKGRDDKTKAYKLGGQIENSWEGFRPVEVPWNVYAFGMTSLTPATMNAQWAQSPEHFQALGQRFASSMTAAHLGMPTTVDNMGGFTALFGGPLGGAAYHGAGYGSGFSAGQQVAAMQAAVLGMLGVYQNLDGLQQNLSAAWLGSQVLR
jgi:hypothetical protein